MSTDERPMHEMCTENCPFRKAKAENKVFHHKNSLPVPVMEKIKPVFRDLASPELLAKCVEGYTQNANESFNNVVWRYCPKHKNHGLITVNQGVGLATGVFNDGAKTYASVMRELGLEIGAFATKCFADMDTERIKHAQRQALASSHEARITRRRQRLTMNELQAEREDLPYNPGGH
ncbi:hypothetical protein V1264_016217 [Littorina saxatilis]|uniref:Uncharacterized protein n=1 Tax=Littorina saxatilis TaxID=31220 RepID=A0AAN9GHC1_9CAEN